MSEADDIEAMASFKRAQPRVKTSSSRFFFAFIVSFLMALVVVYTFWAKLGRFHEYYPLILAAGGLMGFMMLTAKILYATTSRRVKRFCTLLFVGSGGLLFALTLELLNIARLFK